MKVRWFDPKLPTDLLERHAVTMDAQRRAEAKVVRLVRLLAVEEAPQSAEHLRLVRVSLGHTTGVRLCDLSTVNIATGANHDTPLQRMVRARLPQLCVRLRHRSVASDVSRRCNAYNRFAGYHSAARPAGTLWHCLCAVAHRRRNRGWQIDPGRLRHIES